MESFMNALHHLWEQLLQDELERCQTTKKNDRWRPKLHIAPPFGWLNDPNGLCQHQGTYHAFYQFSPFQAKGGLKFWGHCTSQDLLHWKFEGAPLTADQPEDCHGVYSGSALIEDGEMYLYYTGNVKEMGDHDFVNTGRRSYTMLAVSRDGRTIESKEALMDHKDYPSDLTRHVRDPKVWKREDTYYMVQGARTKEDKGIVLLFSSGDKRHWEYRKRFETKEVFGYMWECPDIYELDGRTVLSISPQGVETEGLKYANLYQSVTCFLDGDFRAEAAMGEFRELDGGFDFYAPQTFLGDDGRRIQIAWMGLPDVEEFYTNRTVEDGWQHMMTIPRELSVKNGVLCQNPVKELAEWWNCSKPLQGSFDENVESCCELELHTEGGNLEVVLADGLRLRYNKEEKIFWMEFTDSLLGSGRRVRGREIEELKEMRILIDVSSVEVFINEGTDVFTTRFYPKTALCRVRINGEGCHGTYYFHSNEQ